MSGPDAYTVTFQDGVIGLNFDTISAPASRDNGCVQVTNVQGQAAALGVTIGDVVVEVGGVSIHHGAGSAGVIGAIKGAARPLQMRFLRRGAVGVADENKVGGGGGEAASVDDRPRYVVQFDDGPLGLVLKRDVPAGDGAGEGAGAGAGAGGGGDGAGGGGGKILSATDEEVWVGKSEGQAKSKSIKVNDVVCDLASTMGMEWSESSSSWSGELVWIPMESKSVAEVIELIQALPRPFLMRLARGRLGGGRAPPLRGANTTFKARTEAAEQSAAMLAKEVAELRGQAQLDTAAHARQVEVFEQEKQVRRGGHVPMLSDVTSLLELRCWSVAVVASLL